MQLGLRGKLTLAIVMLMVLFAIFLIVYLPADHSAVARNGLAARARSISLALDAAIEPLLAQGTNHVNDALLGKFAERVGDESELAYVVVIQKLNNTLLAKYLAEDVPETVIDTALVDATDTTTHDGYVQVAVPIVVVHAGAEEQFGTLIAGLTGASVDRAKNSGRLAAIVISGIIIVLGIVVALLVGGQLVTPILQAAHQLDTVSSDLYAAARDQEASSAQEAAAVAETRRSMETLLDSAQQIAERSSEVLGNAERSATGGRQIADRIGNLNELAEQVTELLATIMQVADKADLLALNASLEGTRAGDAGKGFALVAAEMRRLAENVMESVTGIRDLMKNMRDASQAAVVASEEGNRSSTATTRSAREIALLTQSQRKATEQVIASMDEMGDILTHTLDGIQRTTSSAKDLTQLAATLSHFVSPVTTPPRVMAASGPTPSGKPELHEKDETA